MDFKLQGVSLAETTFQGGTAFEITMPKSATQDPARETLTDRGDYMAWLPIDFGDGAIKVDVASVLAPDAPGYTRGFIGMAFRIDPENRFESIYRLTQLAQNRHPALGKSMG